MEYMHLQVHLSQHKLLLQCTAWYCALALNHVTGAQTLECLRSPALWRIFKTDLGILFKLITAKAKRLFQLLEVLLVHFEGIPSGQS